MSAEPVATNIDYADPDVRILHGDALQRLAELPSESVQCIITSPPFWGLRDYGTGAWSGGDEACNHEARTPAARPLVGGGCASWSTRDTSSVYRDACGRCGAIRTDQQIGLEETPSDWCNRLVAVFRECRRVLRDDGVMFVEIGDSYATGTSSARQPTETATHGNWQRDANPTRLDAPGLKPKDLVGAPWKLAEALKAPYYTGQIAAERDRVWLAATLDAEGSISGHRHERSDDGTIRTGCHVTITNTCAALLDEAERIWPASRIQHDSRDGSLGTREAWRWVATNVDRNAMLMRELYPYLIAKRRQAMLAYNLFEMSVVAKRLRTTPEGAQMKERRDWIVENLSRLNRGLDVDVPAWIVEPPTLLEPGWFLRSDCIWARPNPMPESVTDRPTKAHSYVFLLTKRGRYYYDSDAIREPHQEPERSNGKVERMGSGAAVRAGANAGFGLQGDKAREYNPAGRNARTVWSIATEPTPFAHFATFPQTLVEKCLKAGTSERGACGACGAPWRRIVERESAPREVFTNRNAPDDGLVGSGSRINGEMLGAGAKLQAWRDAHPQVTVGWEASCTCNAATRPCVALDPFMGSGTVAIVARRLGRHAIGVELNAEYIAIAASRLAQQSLLA